MSASFTHMTAPSVGDPTALDTFAWLAIDNFEFLYAALVLAQNQGIFNGSFESDSASLVNTAPAEWELSMAVGKSCAIVTASANVHHGAQAFSMTNPGGITGAVSLKTKDFYAIGEDQQFLFSWYNKNTVATVNNSVYVHWYDNAQSLISTTTLFTSSTANPTAWTYYQVVAAAPTTARFFKLEVVGLDNTTAGTAYWDGVTYALNYANGPAFYNAGNGTYSYTPYGRSIRVKMCGGGGGGAGGGGNGNGTAGGDGEDTTIITNGVTYHARGGLGGAYGQAVSTGLGGAGGAGLVGDVGAGYGIRLGVGPGGDGDPGNATNGWGGSGGISGGISGWGLPSGTPGLTQSGAGANATGPAANSGCGGPGGGGGANSLGAGHAGGGGGGGGTGGEVVEMVLPSTPGVPVTIYLGLGGRGGAGSTSGASGDAGGDGADGADGFLIVEG